MEHIPVVQIDLSVPLKVPGKCLLALGLCADVMGFLVSLSVAIHTSPQACPCRTST